jgi:hypothetical protein
MNLTAAFLSLIYTLHCKIYLSVCLMVKVNGGMTLPSIWVSTVFGLRDVLDDVSMGEIILL